MTFGIAITGENLFEALAFATANAITFEVIGPDNPFAATLFTLLTAATNLPDTDMQFIDGRGYGWRGLTGALLADAAVSIALCLLLGWMLTRWRGPLPQRWRSLSHRSPKTSIEAFSDSRLDAADLHSIHRQCFNHVY